MKVKTKLFWLLITALFITTTNTNTYSQSSCSNINFELGDFTNWVGKTGACCPIVLTNTGIVTGRHTIMSDTTAVDPYTNGQLRCIPPGFEYSARLGNDNTGAQAESLTYTMVVDNDNSLFMWKFAVVLEDPGHKPPLETQPRFQITVKDSGGNSVDACAEYLVIAAPTIPGFNNNGGIRWRDWTTVGLNLKDYIGQTISIEIATGDCSQSGHFGYGYFVGMCQGMNLNVAYCSNTTTATIAAPDGFEKYTWSTGDTTQVITIQDPIEGTSYQCTLRSVMGCEAELSTTIRETLIDPDFTWSMTCEGKGYEFTNISTTNIDTLGNFFWDFGDGHTSSEENPVHRFLAPGSYYVKLYVENMLTHCVDSAAYSIPISTIPPDVKIDKPAKFCVGDSVLLKVKGAHTYEWYTGSTLDSVYISTPGDYFVVGTDSINGCVDTLYFTAAYHDHPNFQIGHKAVECRTVRFTAEEKGKPTTENYFYWDFGDGDTNAGGPSVEHVFPAEGEYTIYLKVVNKYGCESEFQQKILVLPYPPELELIGNPILCYADSVLLEVTGADTYKWSTGCTGETCMIYSAGDYFVEGTSVNGCKDTLRFSVSYHEAPDFNIIATEVGCHEYTFDVQAVSGMQPHNSYFWDFGDGTTSSQKTITHTFPKDSTYTVSVTVTNSNLCSTTCYEDIDIYVTPPIKLDKEAKFCPGDSVLLYASGAESYEWSDGSTADSIYISIPGTYYVIGTGYDGCTGYLHFDASYAESPNFRISNTALSSCKQYEFEALEIDTVTTGNKFFWDFGDGSKASGVKVQHTYLSDGEYDIKLTVINKYNCSTEITKKHKVEPILSTLRIDKKPEFCKGDSILLHVTGADKYEWSTGSKADSCYISNAGNYFVVGITAETCRDTLRFTATHLIEPNFEIHYDYHVCHEYHFEAVEKDTITTQNIFFWDFGDGTNSTHDNIVHTFPNDGIYTVTLTVTNRLGCSNTYTETVTVTGMTTISLDKEAKFCEGDSVLLRISGAESYKWSNGSTADSIYISVPGTYFVEGTTVDGCTRHLHFEASYYPEPDFTIETTILSCGLYEFNAKDNSSTPPIGNKFLWDFGDGSRATGQTNTHIFPDEIEYDVKLTVINQYGCTKDFTIKHKVEPLKPNLKLKGELGFCKGDSTTVYISGADSYLWSDGSIADSIYIDTPGNHFVIGTSSENCNDTLYFNTYYLENPDFEIQYNFNKCYQYSFEAVEKSGPTTGNTYFWDFGDSTTSTHDKTLHTFPGDGTYIVTLTVISDKSCSSTYTETITVTGMTTLKLDKKPVFCAGDSVLLFVSGADSYKWSDGSTADSIYIYTPGSYFVEGTTVEGCVYLLNFIAENYPQPDFTIETTIISCKLYEFNAKDNISPATTGNTYLWDFGDGSTASGQKNLHTFADEIEYDIKLTVINNEGCSEEFTIKHKVEPLKPELDLTGTLSFCKGDSTVVYISGADKYLWSNGSTADSIYINAPGDYYVIGTSTEGCRDTLHFSTQLLQNPDFEILYSFNKCYQYYFEAGEKGSPTTGNTYFWDFGDSSISTHDKTLHTFPGDGTYTVTLTVTNRLGCSSTYTETVIVTGITTLKLDKDAKFCQGDSVLLRVSGADSYEWSGGSTADSIYISTPGTYYVEGTTIEGCVYFLSFDAEYYPQPDFTIETNILSCMVYEFNAKDNISPATTGNTYHWDFGDGSTATGQKVSKQYTLEAEFDIKLTVTNQYGCIENFEIKHKVEPIRPNLQLTGQLAFCQGDSTLLSISGANSYLWSNGSTADNTYINTTGNYYVVGISTEGCRDTLHFSTQHLAHPDFEMKYNFNQCYEYYFKAEEKGTPTAGNTYLWDFGDGSATSTLNETPHTFPGDGTYTVTLTVTNTEGCSSTYTETVTVTGMATLKLDKEAKFCVGDSVLLRVSGANTYKWSDGSTADSIYISTPGTYYVEGTTIEGCVYILNFLAEYHPQPDFAIETSVVSCMVYEFNAKDNVSPATTKNTYHWDFGDGSTATGQKVSKQYTLEAEYDIKLTVTNQYGCIENFEIKHKVEPIRPNLQLTGQLAFCQGDSTLLSISGANSYLWSNGSIADNTYINTTGNYYVVGISTEGCRDTLHFSTQHLAHPDFEMKYNFNQCYEYYFKAEEKGTPTAGNTYLWDFGDGSATSTLNETPHTFPGDGTYTVILTVTNTEGCSSTYTETVTVTGMATLKLDKEAKFCMGDSVLLRVSGANTYKWSDGSTADSIYISTPGTYYVEGTTIEGCVYILNFLAEYHPQPDFTIETSVVSCMVYEFNAKDNVSPATIGNTYHWDFGDGSTATGQNIQHKYIDEREYDIILTVINQYGCIETFDIKHNVEPVKPDLQLTGQLGFCQGDSTLLHISGADTYIWSDGSTADSIYIDTPLNYYVIGTSTEGCHDTLYFTTYFLEHPDFEIKYNFAQCSEFYFEALEKGTPTTGNTFHWDFGDGNVSTHDKTLHTYSINGTYTVTLTVTNKTGCSSSYTQTVVVAGVATLVLDKDPKFCQGDSILLHISGADSYIWSNGSTTDSTYISSPGWYHVQGSTTEGCVYFLNFYADYHPEPDFTIETTVVSCKLYEFNAKDNVSPATSGNTYHWDFGDGSTATGQKLQHQYSDEIEYDVILTVTNQYGCIESFEIKHKVEPIKPDLKLTGALGFCKGDSTLLYISGADTYLWSSGSTADSIYIDTPLNYYVIGTSTEGCRDTLYFTTYFLEHPDFEIKYNFAQCSEFHFEAVEKVTPTTGNTFYWDFGDGNTSTHDKTLHTYSANGTYTVILTVTNKMGCSSVYTETIIVAGVPNLALDKDPKFCQGDSVLLRVSGADSYIWSDGSTADSTYISTSGWHHVRGKTKEGCVYFLNFKAEYYPEPDFTVESNLLSCKRYEFNAKDNIVPATTGNTYHWDFGDGSTASGQKIEKKYLLEGEYDVILTVTNLYGCIESFEIKHTVESSSLPDLRLDKTPKFCRGDSVLLYALGADTYEWYNGNTADNIYISTPGDYHVIGISTEGCRDTLYFTAYHPQHPDSFKIDYTISNCKEYIFKAVDTGVIPAKGITYSWNFGDGSPESTINPISHTFNNDGIYTVTLTVSNSECSTIYTETIEVSGSAALALDKEAKFCPGDSVLLHVSGANTYKWSNGSTADSIYISVPGTYHVQGITSEGCVTFLYFDASYFDVPDFSIKSKSISCKEYEFSAEDNIIPATTGNLFYWDFGNNNTASGPVVQNKYNIAGDYKVILTVINIHGCSKDFEITHSVQPSVPDLKLDKTPKFCQGDSVLLYAWGADKYEWSTGSKTDSIYISIPGDYYLVGITSEGCMDTLRFKASYFEHPDNFKIEYKLDNCFEYSFKAIELITADPLNTYLWDFGDTSVPVLQRNPQHTFPGDGEYTVTLTITNKYGCSNVYIETITVTGMATLKLDKEPKFCPGDSVRLYVSGAESYTWSNGKKTDNIYISTPGMYWVEGTTKEGCVYILNFEAKYHDLPDFQIKMEELSCKQYKFTAEELGIITTGNTFYWEFGDGQNGTGKTVEHFYKQAGDYQIKLTVTNQYGCSKNFEDVTLEVLPALKNLQLSGEPKFCVGDSVLLYASGAKSYKWSNGSTADHVYISKPGDYFVVGIPADGGCRDTLFFKASHYDHPNFKIKYELSTCHEFNFEAQETGNVTTGNKYLWDFGDGLPGSTLKTPSHTFPKDGSYIVRLTVISKDGCVGKDSTIVSVSGMPELKIDKEAVFCEGDSVLLQVSGAQTYRWSNGSTSNKIYVSKPGIYYVIGTTADGCEAHLSFEAAYAPVPDFEINITPGSCSYWLEADEKGNDLAGNTYNWDLGDGNMAYSKSLPYSYANAGTYALSLTITNRYGCSATKTKKLTVDVTPKYEVDWKVLNCDNRTYQFYALELIGGMNGHTYYWDFADGFYSTEQNPVHRFATDGIHLISLTVTNSDDCSVDYKFNFSSKTAPELYLDKEEPALCVGGTLELQVMGAETYMWSNGTSGDKISITEPGEYSVTGFSSFGCSAELKFTVSAHEEADYRINYQLIDCQDKTVQFTAVNNNPSGITNDSFLWDFGNGSTAEGKTVEYQYTTPGEHIVKLYVITNGNACMKEVEQTIKISNDVELELDKEPLLCKGDSIVLYVNGAIEYRWDDGSTGDSIVIRENGPRSVTGYVRGGCSATLRFNVNYFESFEHTLQSSVNDVSLTPTKVDIWTEERPNSDYYWDFGDGTKKQSYSNIITHTYYPTEEEYFDVKVRVINPDSECDGIAQKRIWVIPTELPNTFTPNNDGVNDIFMRGWHIQVFNRNGLLMYDGTDGWDGNYKGKPSNEDTYFYVLYYKTAMGERSQQGFVTLIRNGL